jgi:multiple sugar transport system substrate-binding protein
MIRPLGGARATIAATAALTLVALAACRGAQAGATRVTLRFWAMGAEADALSTLVRGFERQHPDIRVDVQAIPWTAAHEKLMTAFVGDATPDLTQLGNTWIPEFTAIGALEPLDSMAARTPAVDSADYFAGIWDTNVIHGVLYGIPWYVDTRLLFYRTDILAAAGYDSMPGSWTGWRNAMEAIQRKAAGQPRRWPIFLPTNEWNEPVIFGMQNGSTLLRDDDRYGDFSDSAFRSAFDFYVRLYRDKLAPIAGINDMANPYQEFARGTFAMWITGPWNIGEFKRRLPDSLQHSWATAPIPGPDGDSSGISLAGGASFAIFRASQHKSEAWQLIQYLSEPAQQLAFYHLSGDLPARLDVWRQSGLETDRYAHAFWVQLHRVRATPKVPEWESITSKIIDQSEESIRGGVAPARSLGALDHDVNAILDKRRWILSRDSARSAGHAP